MRSILCFGMVLGIVTAAAADETRNPCPTGSNPLYALTRHCMNSTEFVRRDRKICNYDCLISTESITVDAKQYCPITVKQMLFGDGTQKIVMPDTVALAVGSAATPLVKPKQ